MEQRIARLDALLAECGRALKESQSALIASARAGDTCPFPSWVKACDGTMLWINNEYSVRYGVTLEDYQNRKDVEIWGEETAAVFRVADDAVCSTRQPWRGVEACGDGTLTKVLKWPALDETGTKILGVCGMVLE